MTRKILSFVGVALVFGLVSFGMKYLLRDTVTSRHAWQSAFMGLFLAILWHIPWNKRARKAVQKEDGK